MARRSRNVWLTAVLPGMLPGSVHAQQTSTGSISVQGKLAGIPDGTRTISVRFYNAATGGNLMASTPGVPAAVANGVFSAAVCPPPATFDGRDLWWAAVVDGDELSPRTLMTSAPSALTLGGALTLVGPAPYAAVANNNSLFIRNPDSPAGHQTWGLVVGNQLGDLVLGRSTDSPTRGLTGTVDLQLAGR